MKIYTNYFRRRQISGGANSFLKVLHYTLRQRGVKFTNNLDDSYDIAFINALTSGVSIEHLRYIYSRGIPLIHRAVGYSVSGSQAMRSAVLHGFPYGEYLQLCFTPYVNHTIFQSNWSFNQFKKNGFHGEYSVIPNGVDISLFYPRRRPRFDSRQKVRIAIVSWSTDIAKGFPLYREIDKKLPYLPFIEVVFVGRTPHKNYFSNIKSFRPMSHIKLASFLRSCDGYIHFAACETCSNALLEALATHLPVLYLDSGSTSEFCRQHGCIYGQDITQSLEEFLVSLPSLRKSYDRAQLHDIRDTSQAYINLFKFVLDGC